tara:strand:+ start:78 stop:1358 length:1281 start_codon:yes stop_codon:yes gene_type:complete
MSRGEGEGTMSARSIRVPEPGVLIDGKYRVVREIGVGGMGVVLEGIDETLDRRVAIKLVAPTFAAFEDYRERIQQEAKAMATVRHENVVRIYAYGEHGAVPYFVMELVRGSDLSYWLDRYDTEPPSIDEALGILDQICRGLAAVHEAGIIHGDVKPANVLLGPAFQVAVTDFGLFRAMGGEQEEGMVVGTPAYIAPEIVRGTVLRAEPRSDLYSLGVLAYQMLTGHLPVLIRTHSDMFRAHREEGVITPASQLRSDLPPTFDAPLAMAMQRDPERRPASIEEFRRALLTARQQVGTRPASMRIVVADDDPDFLALISETLGFAFPGSAIECVTDGTQALASLDARRADLAVVDLDMPGMNGIELTAAVRAKPGLRDLPILVVTARGGAPDWQLLQSMGAKGFLLKPLDAYALITMARRAVGVSPAP